jgi:hypothetical protein
VSADTTGAGVTLPGPSALRFASAPPRQRKAAMVSNMLVVLRSDHPAQPVVNAGTLYQ